MNTKRLGRSGIVVSDICLGTMTFGSSCDEAEAFRIMDRSYDAGIDFLDAAEIYPVPPKEEYMNETERIVGKWLKTKPRESVIIATKVTGPGHGWFKPPIRKGKTALDRHNIRVAIEGSLERLQTDYIDLYQTHWPDHEFPYEETLETLDELVQDGMVRVIGCSNETPWGLMKSLAVAEAETLPRYDTIQNNFSLANRRFEDALADICTREKVSCLPYSPLAGGVLTGKYNASTPPENARFSQYLKSDGDRQKKMAHRFLNEKSLNTTAELMDLAKELGTTATTLAVAWSKQFDWVASTIIGANTVEQLEDSLKAADLEITPEINAKIDAITAKYPYPMG